MHGGAIATLIDTVVVPAIGTAYDDPRLFSTIQMSVRYTGPVRQEDLVAEGWVSTSGQPRGVLRRRGAHCCSGAGGHWPADLHRGFGRFHGNAVGSRGSIGRGGPRQLRSCRTDTARFRGSRPIPGGQDEVEGCPLARLQLGTARFAGVQARTVRAPAAGDGGTALGREHPLGVAPQLLQSLPETMLADCHRLPRQRPAIAERHRLRHLPHGQHVDQRQEPGGGLVVVAPPWAHLEQPEPRSSTTSSVERRRRASRSGREISSARTTCSRRVPPTPWTAPHVDHPRHRRCCHRHSCPWRTRADPARQSVVQEVRGVDHGAHTLIGRALVRSRRGQPNPTRPASSPVCSKGAPVSWKPRAGHGSSNWCCETCTGSEGAAPQLALASPMACDAALPQRRTVSALGLRVPLTIAPPRRRRPPPSRRTVPPARPGGLSRHSHPGDRRSPQDQDPHA